MQIRLAKKEDAAALVEFNQAMALETEGKLLDPETLRQGVEAVFASNDKGFYVVAEDSSRIVGGLMVTFEWSDWRNGWFWWIQSVYVVPDARGKGLYSQLYDFVKDKGSLNGDVRGFRLYVERDNLGARRVYEKVGMKRSHYEMYEEEI